MREWHDRNVSEDILSVVGGVATSSKAEDLGYIFCDLNQLDHVRHHAV